MKNWTLEPGYPLVRVSRKEGKVILTQERYFSSPQIKNRNFKPWLIPIDIISDDKKNQETYLMSKNALSISGFSKSKWIKINPDETSFIRVKYGDADLEALEIPIKNKDRKLGEEVRFSLVRDAFALVEAGYTDASEALDLISAYKNEDSYIVWAEIVTHILEFENLVYGTKIHMKFRDYGKDILSKVVKKAGFKKGTNETHFQTLLRSAVTYASGTLGNEQIIDHAKDLFEKSHNGGRIDSDLKSAVYALVAENGGKNEFKRFEKIYKNGSSEEEMDRALRALCSFKNRVQLERTLELAFSDDVRVQDAFKAVSLMASNPFGIDLAWEYVKKHWSEIVERFAGGHLFARFILPFSKFKTVERANEIEEFFIKNKATGIERTVSQTIEKIKSNADFLRRDFEVLKNYVGTYFNSQ